MNRRDIILIARSKLKSPNGWQTIKFQRSHTLYTVIFYNGVVEDITIETKEQRDDRKKWIDRTFVNAHMKAIQA